MSNSWDPSVRVEDESSVFADCTNETPVEALDAAAVESSCVDESIDEGEE
jgi:hypothetical protein